MMRSPSTASSYVIIIFRPHCNRPNKSVYDVTFALRFLCGKQMDAFEQIRVASGATLVFSTRSNVFFISSSVLVFFYE